MAEKKVTSVFVPIGDKSNWSRKPVSGEIVEILYPLTEMEADLAVTGPMYHVRFSDGGEADVYLDELPDLCKQIKVNRMREKLLPHRGHRVVCASYGDWDNPADVCIECEDCGCVLVSTEDFEPEG